MPSSKGRGRRHTHKRKGPDTEGFSLYMAYKVCETCGKQCYLTRAEAKRSARVNHPDCTMHEYKCEEPSGKVWWHLSSIPADRLAQLRRWEREQRDQEKRG